MNPDVFAGAALESHEAAVAAAEEEPPIGDVRGRRDARVQLPAPPPLAGCPIDGRDLATGAAEIDAVVVHRWRRPDFARALDLPASQARCPIHRVHRPVVCAEEHEVAGDGRGRVEGGLGLIAPAFSAVAAVEGVKAAVAAGHVEHAIAQHRAGPDGVAERGFPDQLGRRFSGCAATPPRRSLVASSVTQLVSGCHQDDGRSFDDRSSRDPRLPGRARMRS